MPVTNPAAIRFASPLTKTDQIIGVFTGTLSVDTPTFVSTPKTATASHAHGFGDSCYFHGIFSTDGGTTWNDFGAQIPDVSGGGKPVSQTADCEAYVDTTNLVVTGYSYYNSATGIGLPRTIQYKVYLLAKNSMALPIRPIATAERISWSSRYNYQKIAAQGTINLTVASGSTGSVVVTHNLGYVPKIRAFLFYAATPTVCQSLSDDNNGNFGSIYSVQSKVTSTDVTFYADRNNWSGVPPALNVNIEYRVYQD